MDEQRRLELLDQAAELLALATASESADADVHQRDSDCDCDNNSDGELLVVLCAHCRVFCPNSSSFPRVRKLEENGGTPPPNSFFVSHCAPGFVDRSVCFCSGKVVAFVAHLLLHLRELLVSLRRCFCTNKQAVVKIISATVIRKNVRQNCQHNNIQHSAMLRSFKCHSASWV